MRRTPRTHRTRAGRVAALACVGALALSGCDFSVYDLPLPGGADLGDDPYSVRVQFRDVLDLVPQSAVKVNDVTVGKVDDIEVDGFTAEVTLLLREDVKLPENALAEIRQTSLLGEKFVSLEAPETGASQDLLSDGELIPLESSGRNPEVEEVLGAMSLLLNGGGVAQLKTIATELNKALDGRESDVKSVLRQLDTFMGQLDRNKQDIVEAIESLNRLAVSINKQRGSIELALDEMPAGARLDRPAARRPGEDAARARRAQRGRHRRDPAVQDGHDQQPGAARPGAHQARRRRGRAAQGVPGLPRPTRSSTRWSGATRSRRRTCTWVTTRTSRSRPTST